MTQEHRKLQERLEGARTNLRFADKRIADLEVQLLEHQQAARSTPSSDDPPCGERAPDGATADHLRSVFESPPEP